MNTIDKKLYGSYPHPYHNQEYKNGFGCVPRSGPDNITLILQGYQALDDQRTMTQWRPTSNNKSHAPPYATITDARVPAGVPTNNNYDVYSHNAPGSQGFSAALPAAGQYHVQHPGDIPRSGRGAFACTSMKDHLQIGTQGLAGDQRSSDFYHGPDTYSPTGQHKAPGSLIAVAHNKDSLEAFMTGIAGVRSGGHNKEVEFDNYYGKAHSGKATLSHISPEVNGLQGPTAPLDNLPHMRTTRQGHTSQLESDLEGGYIPREAAAWSHTGVRSYHGLPQAQDHLQVSPTGLSSDQKEVVTGPRRAPIGTNMANISMSDMGLSHHGQEAGYPAVRNGRYTSKFNVSSLTPKAGGLSEFGEQAVSRNPWAGASSRSQITAGVAGLGGAEPGREVINPHAGKGQASQITHSSGTVTIVPQVNGPELRKPAIGKDRWSTTHDDTYSVVQVSNNYAARHNLDYRPHRF